MSKEDWWILAKGHPLISAIMAIIWLGLISLGLTIEISFLTAIALATGLTFGLIMAIGLFV
ncbi:MAG: hypothetical protein R3221_04785 [Spongiibacter sp.]|nr:hypothetical protein [Spongiibacter sp.]